MMYKFECPYCDTIFYLCQEEDEDPAEEPNWNLAIDHLVEKHKWHLERKYKKKNGYSHKDVDASGFELTLFAEQLLLDMRRTIE